MVDNSDFLYSLQKCKNELLQKMFSNMEQACIFVQGEAMENCPVDMGILRASIHHETIITPTSIIGTVGSNLEYAPYVHQGTGIYAVDGNGRKTPWGYEVHFGKYKGFHWTHGQKPRPFLKNAVFDNIAQIERILKG